MKKLIGKQFWLKPKSLASLLVAVFLFAAPVFSEATDTVNTNLTKQEQSLSQNSEQNSTAQSQALLPQKQNSAQQSSTSQNSKPESTQLSNLLDEQDNLLNLFDSKLTTLEAQVTTLEQSVKDSSATNSQLESQLKSCKTTISNLRTDLSQFGERLQASNESLAQAYSELDAYDRRIANAEKRVKASHIAGPVLMFTSGAAAGVAAFGLYEFANGNDAGRYMLIYGGAVSGICTLTWCGGSFVFKIW